MRWKFFIFAVFAALLGFAPVVADEVQQDEETEFQTTPVDDEIAQIQRVIDELGWCPEGDSVPNDTRKAELCKMLKAAEAGYSNALADNTKDLEENYKNMKEKENSLENRMLGGVGIGTVGIGGMMVAQSLVEQNADKSAEQDMQAYLSTFSCRYGEKTARGGEMGLEIPGSNHLINLYQKYAELSQDLKTRKDALGLKPGIESEIVIDKATTGLYDDVGTGIGSGAYASIARALRDPNGEDAKRWAEQKESTASNLKTGAITAGAGVVASMAGNYLINHDNKNRSDELLADRATIKEKYKSVSQQIIDECNKTIQEHKDFVKSHKAEAFASKAIFQEYKAAVEAAQPVTTLNEIVDSEFCR